MESPAISVHDVCFSYTREEVLHNVSFTLPRRSFAVVVGPNGGGKTTLLRLLLGDLKPRWGEVSVFGGPPAKARRRVGYVPQRVVFDSEFPVTVLEAVMLGRVATRVLGGFSRADREAGAAALRRVGLAGLEKRPFSALSGGQRQRAIVAQAICSNPELYFLDEPTANVDARTERDLVELFAELAAEATVVAVSHNPGVVAARATHVLCVNRTADLHELGTPGAETSLEPYSRAKGPLAVLRNAHPGHLEGLLESLETPHHGKEAHPHGADGHCGSGGCEA